MRDLIESIVRAVLELQGVPAYLVIAILAMGESAAFVGLVTPGEISMVLGGVLASRGRVSLPLMMAVAGLGAAIGDSVGYWLGRKVGRRIMSLPGLRRVEGRLAGARRYFREHGRRAVFLGRWVSVVRTFIPFVAGNARMPYGRFLLYGVPGAFTWAWSFVLVGFVLGASWRVVEGYLGPASLVVLLLVVLAVAIRWTVGRLAERRASVEAGVARVGATRPARWIASRYGAELRWLARRFDPRVARGLGLTSLLVVLALAGWVTGEVIESLVSRQGLVRLEPVVARWFAEHRTPPLAAAAGWVLAASGIPWGLAALGVVVAVVWLAGDAGGALRVAAGVVGALGVSLVVGAFLPAGTGRFPSERLAVLGASAVHVTVVAARARGWRAGVAVAGTWAFVASVLGVALLVAGRGTLSAIVGGAALGAAWAALLEAPARLPVGAPPVRREAR